MVKLPFQSDDESFTVLLHLDLQTHDCSPSPLPMNIQFYTRIGNSSPSTKLEAEGDKSTNLILSSPLFQEENMAGSPFQ